MNKNTITVAITCFNEEKHINECIQSARLLTDDIIVIDTQSTDTTVSKARKAGVQVFTFPNKRYVEPSRIFALEKAQGEWIFILDADERISQALSREIKSTVSSTDKTHFVLPRKNIFAQKKWLRHGGWYPDFVTRLIQKKAFVGWSARIHSSPVIKGERGVLKNALEHYFHSNVESMVEKTAVFENIESDLLFKAGKTATTRTFFRKFFGELWRRLFKGMGFLDGTYGIIESIYQAYSKTITYLMLYEKNKKTGNL